jgi:hypothetical protein
MRDTIEEDKAESDMEKRKRVAKESAMAKMKAQAAKFALMMDVDSESVKMTSLVPPVTLIPHLRHHKD